MKKLTGNEVRKSFIEFFKEKEHTFVPSSSLVPGGDATLLFTNAGMVQFKDVFLGTDKRTYTRAVNSQKCMRVAGKHNDLEDVGQDDSHHTFFEMLGNWSFGDYYKEQAISWAWELLTEEWGLPGEQLYATVFKDEKGKIPTDDEAVEYWLKQPGFDQNRLFYFGRKDNFWEMANTGPCGPCSEIHIDLKPELGPVKPEDIDTDRFLELWNLVFIQYNRIDENHLDPLPETHVDTGMGFERIVSVLQNKSSNYTTDLLHPLIKTTQKLTDHSDNEVEHHFTPYRVIADHARAAAFLVNDGVIPGNLGRNYVCRMIIRRAFRFGGKIGLTDPFLGKVAETVIENYGEAYPDLKKNADLIFQTIRREEEQFQRTLEKATGHLEVLLTQLENKGESTLDGEIAADLYTTYGMPFEISLDIARERNLEIDEEGFASAMEAHRLASGAGKPMGGPGGQSVEIYRELRETLISTGKLDSSGVIYDPYGSLTFDSSILAINKDNAPVASASEGDQIEIVMPLTHFYMEAGGQVADTGTLQGDGWVIEIEQAVKPAAKMIMHEGKVVHGVVHVDDLVSVHIDKSRRMDIRRNHTATHLLHAGLHVVLGDHARQAGSLVAPDRLRFDFTHPQAVSDDELKQIETLVNQWILENHNLEIDHKALQDALDGGAMALFGEKYDETVRTISIGDTERFSYELCGGTHVGTTNEIGTFVITSEGSVASGIRRIEAITGTESYKFIRKRMNDIQEIAHILGTSADRVTEKVGTTLGEYHEAKKTISSLRQKLTAMGFNQVMEKVIDVKGIHTLTYNFEDATMDTLSMMADQFRKQFPEKSIAVLAGVSNQRPIIVTAVTDDLIKRGIKAGELVNFVAKPLGGGGGGRPTFAQAGGKDSSKLPEALASVTSWIEGKLS